MMDQYQNETVQIHASAALIEKTKAAVREEEDRIRRGQTVHEAEPVLRVAYADYAAYQKKHSLRRWTYPVTVAAAVVILVSVSMAMRGVRSGDSMSGQADADMLTAAEEEAYVEAEEMSGAADSEAVSTEMSGGAVDDAAASAEMSGGAVGDTAASAEMNGGTAGEAAASKKMENTAGAAMDSAAMPEEAGDGDRAMAGASAADSAEEDAQRGIEKESSIRESAKVEQKDQAREDSTADAEGADTVNAVEEFRSKQDDSVRIEVVKERPDFYADPDAADIIHEGRTFRVTKEKKGWAAYVETEAGEAYVIRGEIRDRDVFLREAYVKLTEETGTR